MKINSKIPKGLFNATGFVLGPLLGSFWIIFDDFLMFFGGMLGVIFGVLFMCSVCAFLVFSLFFFLFFCAFFG